MSVQFGEVLSRQYTGGDKPNQKTNGLLILGAGVRVSVTNGAIPLPAQNTSEPWRMETAGSAVERDRGSANPGGTFPSNLVRGDVDPSLPAAAALSSAPIPKPEKYLSAVVTVAHQGEANHFDSSKERTTYEKLKSCFQSLLRCCCC